MKNIPLLLGTIVGTVVLIIVVATMFSSDSSTNQNGAQVADTAIIMEGARHTLTTGETATETDVLPDNEDVVMQNPDSEDSTHSADAMNKGEKSEEKQELVTIVEFSDFQCPACKAAQPAIELVKANYAGKVQIVFRHFPLDSIHPNARLAAQASEAAAALDEATFWPYHDVLFENQAEWSNIRDRQELKETFVNYATGLGLDKAQFLEKMEDGAIAELVNNDVSAATKLNVNATPTFYVNGIKTSASQLSATVETVLSE